MKHLVLLIALLSVVTLNAQERKFLLIGIDGCRPDALLAADTPAMDALTAEALYSYDALTQFPTYSGPGWSSMLTGVWSDKHGVTDNSFAGSNYGQYPHMFVRMKEADPTLYLASVCHWGPINDEITQMADVQTNVDTMAEAESNAIDLLEVDELDGLFVHLDEVDHAGHTYGFDAAVPEYLAAIEESDVIIGNLITAIQERPNFANEEWLIVVSTDHGGIGTSHGGSSYEERNIFLFFSSELFPNDELSAEYDTWEGDASNALNLNQNNVYGTLDHEVYEFGDNEDFTIELKIKTNGWTGDPAIISDKDWNSGFNPGLVMACQFDEETWKFNLGDGTDRIDLDGGVINDGEWHHIAVSCDRDGQTFIWQDGQVMGSIETGLTESIVSGLPLSVGQDGTTDYEYDFDGWIDELRIWNVAMDTGTLSSWACADLGVFHEQYDNLIGYWKMEEIADIVIDGTDPNNQVDLDLVNGPYISLEGPMTCQAIVNEPPEIVDIMPTICAFMCIEVLDSWEMDGDILGIDYSLCDVNVNEKITAELVISPSINSGIFNVIWPGSTPAQTWIVDASGRILTGPRLVPGNNSIDLNLSPGVYQLSAEDGEVGRFVVVD